MKENGEEEEMRESGKEEEIEREWGGERGRYANEP